MSVNRLSAWLVCAIIVVSATPTWACIQPRSGSAADLAEGVRNRQTELWARSDAVFLSQASGFEVVDVDGLQGFKATLSPSLALKGELPIAGIGISHTTATSCGLIPFLGALAGTEGDWFVTYVRALPSGLSVDATISVSELVDGEALRAWRKAYPISAVASED